MKYALILIILLLPLLIFTPKSSNPIVTSHIEIEHTKSIDLVSILTDFFSNDFPITNLLISINDNDIYISGNLQKNKLQSFLNEQNMLDFKTEIALLALKDDVFVKINLNPQTTKEQFTLTIKNIQIEDFSIDVNFLIYTLKF